MSRNNIKLGKKRKRGRSSLAKKRGKSYTHRKYKTKTYQLKIQLEKEIK